MHLKIGKEVLPLKTSSSTTPSVAELETLQELPSQILFY